MTGSLGRSMKGKLVQAASLLIAAALIVLLILLYNCIEETPEFKACVADFLSDRLAGQNPIRMDLELEVSVDRFLEGRASITMKIEPEREILYFVLNGGFDVSRVRWNGEDADCLDLGLVIPACRVKLPRGTPLTGNNLLEVEYSGRLPSPGSYSVFSQELVYLAPEDRFYPRISERPMEVNLNVAFPPGLQPVADTSRTETVRYAESSPRETRTAASWTLPGEVSLFSVAGCAAEPIRISEGETNIAVYPYGSPGAIPRDTLRRLSVFFSRRLGPLRPKAMRFIVVPSDVARDLYCDEAGTILFPEKLGGNGLAYAFAFIWLGKGFPPGTLFSREEMARAWAQYYFSQAADTGQRLRYCAAAPGDQGGDLLSLFRRMVGDELFDTICLRMFQLPTLVEEGQETVTRDVSGWIRCCEEFGIQGYDWFFRQWVGERRRLDLAITDFSVIRDGSGYQFSVSYRNLGDFDLPEKVDLVLMTREGAIRREIKIFRNERTWNDYVMQEVTGVALDPEGLWPDLDRENNVSYRDCEPFLVVPSPDDRFLAVATRKEAGTSGGPLLIRNRQEGGERLYRLEMPVAELRWIRDDLLLVKAGQTAEGGMAAENESEYYLVDANLGKKKLLGKGIGISPSSSGEFIVINEWRNNRWRHRLYNLKERLERPFLNRVMQYLEFIDGADLLKAVNRQCQPEAVEIYSITGRLLYRFRHREMELFHFMGHEGSEGKGILFLARANDVVSLYAVSSKMTKPKKLLDLESRQVHCCLDEAGQHVYIHETFPAGGTPGESACRQVVSRYDLAAKGVEVLYDGEGEERVQVFHKRGIVLIDRERLTVGEERQRLYFRWFATGSDVESLTGRWFVKDLTLVDSQRVLYCSLAVPTPGFPAVQEACDPFTMYKFFRYDFEKRLPADEIRFGAPEN